VFETLPATAAEFSTWTWPQIAPYYEELLARPLSSTTIDQWMADWTRLGSLHDEVSTRFTVATTIDTADEETGHRFRLYLDEILPEVTVAEQEVKQKLIASGIEPVGFGVPLQKIRTDANLFQESNVPLLSEQRKLSLEYDKISGARTVVWEGREIPWVQLYPVLEEPDRARRESAWHQIAGRVLEDTEALSELWRRMMAVRWQLAQNAGFADYRGYRWQQLYRYDYSPEDAKHFHSAIEEVVVPAAERCDIRRRERLDIRALRPWDIYADPSGRSPLHPYSGVEELESKTGAMFTAVDPQLGDYFETMRRENLLDLDSRKNKASGGYQLAFSVTGRPFIFANAVGTHDDVQTLLHEGGHAFHTFEMAGLPYLQQRSEQMLPMEFAEVASMGMELLAAPYLNAASGGFYSEAEAARARIDVLEGFITFWPYMAMIDALQHWIYEHHQEASDLARCDDYWVELSSRFRPQMDWSGLDVERRAFWHSQSHVFQDPFYYIEYGMAQLGAVQIWANALHDQAGAVASYRKALALGGTATLPELYAAAGARFAFDAGTLQRAVDLIEHTIAELEPQAARAS
jgi:oligoendopeptidase F